MTDPQYVDFVRGGVRALEYTVSIVSAVLYCAAWWYGALDAAAVFLLIPTYFATSLMTFHLCFRYFAPAESKQKKQ